MSAIFMQQKNWSGKSRLGAGEIARGEVRKVMEGPDR